MKRRFKGIAAAPVLATSAGVPQVGDLSGAARTHQNLRPTRRGAG